MKNILYIGNKLAGKNRTATTIDTLGFLLEKQGYTVRYASNKTSKITRLIDMILSVYRNRKWCDVVLIDTYSTLNFWYAIIVGRLCKWVKIKYIPILHGGNLPLRLETHPKILHSFLKNAFHIVSPSDYLKHAFAKAEYLKITVIPNNINLDQYPLLLDRHDDRITLLWVRSIAQIYNPHMAIKVAARLQEAGYECDLIMVGPDKENLISNCKQLAISLNVTVNFTGLLSKTDWMELSKKATYFINTANYDNLPVSIIEAMALGLPVISTDVGGISHLISDGDNGLLVAKNDDAVMADALIKLQEQPDLKLEIATQGYHTAKLYDWKTVSTQWEKLLS